MRTSRLPRPDPPLCLAGRSKGEKAAVISTFQEAAKASHWYSPITAEILSSSIFF
jgi:hypothetical protein